ncbi:MAG TPA: hypothetical protein VMZ53_23005 [Kofleriaceae bacterium]|nr:hypothetical protein [Kofleriaceae bacterium]
MKKMLFFGALAVVGCGGGQKQTASPPTSTPPLANSAPAEATPPTPKTETELAMDKMRGFRDQFCMCKDSDCARRVSDDMTAWAQDMAKKSDEPPKMTDAQTKEMQQIGTQMGDCMVKAMQGSAPPPTGNNP